jgi:hypothetical protein
MMCRPGFASADTPNTSRIQVKGTGGLACFNPETTAVQLQPMVVVSWISKVHRGMYQSVYHWALQGGGGPDTDTRKKAVECLRLLKPLDQPKDLPGSPHQIITVRGFDGDKTLEKKFPIDRVPPEVHQILTVMGFGDERCSRLRFVQRTE